MNWALNAQPETEWKVFLELWERLDAFRVTRMGVRVKLVAGKMDGDDLICTDPTNLGAGSGAALSGLFPTLSLPLPLSRRLDFPSGFRSSASGSGRDPGGSFLSG